MLPTFLITLRETIEASLIVATILGILIKLNQKNAMWTVWIAICSALIVSFLLVFSGSLIGINIRQLYAGKSEPAIEGFLLIVSSFFVTWSVFFIHRYFAHQKINLLKQMKETITQNEHRGVFMLSFVAVLREGIEIALFLSTIYLTSSSVDIIVGFIGGLVSGIIISLLFFSATVRAPVFYAFRITGLLLIFFAGGLLARGLGELLELYPIFIPTFTFSFLPDSSTFIGNIVKTIFGITRSMHSLQLIFYTSYVYIMHWWVFIRISAVAQEK